MANLVLELTRKQSYDCVYIKGFLATPAFLRIARGFKERSGTCRVAFEVATYPYQYEYRQLLKADLKAKNLRGLCGHLLELWQHGTTFTGFSRYVDRIVVFGAPVKWLWGIPAMQSQNGVSVKNIPLRTFTGDPAVCSLLGVAGTSFYHGYWRVVEGMHEYYQRGGQQNIQFFVVGENRSIDDLKQQVHQLALQEHVHFLGYRNAQELNRLYCENLLGVAPLGTYVTRLIHASPLKTREFCAAGVPFLFGYEEKYIDQNTPFALKLPNDPTPVDMEAVLSFAATVNEELSRQEREFAEQHCDWQSIMEEILQFMQNNPEEE